jgi:hypothetical protein
MEWNQEKRLMKRHVRFTTSKLETLELIAWIVSIEPMLFNQFLAEILPIGSYSKWVFKVNPEVILLKNSQHH